MTESAITHVVVQIGTDGDGYYTGMYANGEPGPRSEGYRGRTTQEALQNAHDAAERDFPGVEIRVVAD